MKEYIDKQKYRKILRQCDDIPNWANKYTHLVCSISDLPTITQAELESAAYNRGAREFAEKLKEKFRDFNDWETEDGHPIHTMSETQRIYKCINFVDELLKEMGCE